MARLARPLRRGARGRRDPDRVLLGSEGDLDSVIEAIGKIRSSLDELRTADHRLLRLKSMSRGHRDRAVALGL